MRKCKSDKELHRTRLFFSKKFKNLYCEVRPDFFNNLGTKRSEHLVERQIRMIASEEDRMAYFWGRTTFILCREFKKIKIKIAPPTPLLSPAQFHSFIYLFSAGWNS
jgi:hypothetical protein